MHLRYGSLVLLGIAAVSIFSTTARAGTYTVFGPTIYVRESGSPIVEVSNFSVPDPSKIYTLTIYNGGLEDDEVTGDLVSSSIIMMNGVVVVGSKEFNQNTFVIRTPLELKANNEFSVELRGKPGGLLYIFITGEDSEPPIINITAPPAFVANERQPDIVVEYVDVPAGVDLSTLTILLDGTDITTASVVGPASATYSPPAPLASGAHQVVATISDNAGNSASDTHDFTLNTPPTAVDDTVSTDEDTPASITTSELLANDEDPDDPETLTVVSVQGAVNGTVSLSGGIVFTPDSNFNGSAGFQYTIQDQGGEQSTASVVVTVDPVNDTPMADDQSVTTDEDVALPITLTASDVDGDSLTYSVGNPSNGALSGTAPDLTYTPNANFNGSDSFTFTVNDGLLDSPAATVGITVFAVNDVPVADAQSVTTDENMAVNITLSGGDVDGDSFTFSVVTGPTNGTLSGIAPDLTYTPNADYDGPDSFTFVTNDGTVDSASATVSITVEPTSFTAVDDTFQILEDTPGVFRVSQLLANDKNRDPSESYFLLFTDNFVNGTFPKSMVQNPEELAIEFTPEPNFSGTASFDYWILVGFGGNSYISIATVTIEVTPVADTPTLTVQDREGMELVPVQIFLGAELVDTDGSETLSVAIDGLPETWTVSGGTVTPPAGAAGQAYSVLVTATATESGNGDTATASETVMISVFDGIDLGLDATEISHSLPGEFAGYSVDIVGDLNGDGLDELFIGAPEAEPDGKKQQGRAYLVYGTEDGMAIDLADVLSGTAGFAFIGEDGGFSVSDICNNPFISPCAVITSVGFSSIGLRGPRGDGFGFAVSRAGDVNGDGVEDLFVSAPYAKGERVYQGKSYVWFGDPTNTSGVLASDIALDSNDSGFRILGKRGSDLTRSLGPNGRGQDGDLAGWSIDSMRDFNGDGLADLLVSAVDYGEVNQGRIYVVFGKEDGAEILLSELADESNADGLIVDADVWESRADVIEFGQFVRSIGDFNGDGLSDFIFTRAWVGSGPGIHLVWGKEDLTNIVIPSKAPDFSNYPDGFTLPIAEGLTVITDATFLRDSSTGFPTDVVTGHYFGAADVGGGGDVNGDGLADVVMGGRGADEDGTPGYFQQTLVGFGSTGIGSVTVSDIMSGSGAGFVIKSNEGWTSWKNETTIIGDVNGDGFDDILIGASLASVNATNMGKAYVVFGKADSSPVNLSDVAFGNGGFVLLGEPESGHAGFSVSSSGDVNGDGLADILIGAPYVDVNGQINAGKTYLVYGGLVSSAITHEGTTGDDTLTGDAGINNFAGGLGDDLMVGNGGADVYYGGAGDDIMVIADAGFRRAYGGNGTDTLALEGNGTTVDLSADGGRLDGIEQIDLGASGDQTLILSRLALLNLSPNSNTLVVFGGLGTDLVHTAQEDRWVNEGTEVIEARTFTKFTDGRAILYIETLIGTLIPPVIPAQTLYIDENSANGTSAGTVLATDADGGPVSNYLITGGNTGNVFQIDSVTAEITLVGSLDFETIPAYGLTVQVTDDDGLVGAGIVDVAVNDLNEAPQIDQAQVNVSVAEHTPTGTVVATVTATDVDAGDVLTFAMGDSLSGASFTDSAGFALNSATGEIYVSNAILLDFESDAQREFSVNVTDAGGLSATAIQVQITLTDVTSFLAPFEFILETQAPRSLWKDGSSTYAPDPVVIPLSREIGSPITWNAFAVGVSFDMGIDATITAEMMSEAGDVSAILPFTVEVTVPDEVQVGVPFTLSSTFVLGAGASISGLKPTNSSSVRADIKNLEAIGKIFGYQFAETIFDVQVDDFAFERSYGTVVDPDLTPEEQENEKYYTGMPTSLGSREVKITEPIIDQVFQASDFTTEYQTELNNRGIPNDGFGSIRLFVDTVEELLIEYVSVSTGQTGTINMVQDLSLLVNTLWGTVTFENGTPFTWNIGDDEILTLDNSYDVNPPDGRVDFDIEFFTVPTFTTTSSYSLTLRHDIDAGQFKVIKPGYVLIDGVLFNNIVILKVDQLVNLSAAITTMSTPEVKSFPLTNFNTYTGSGSIDLGPASMSPSTSLLATTETTETDSDESSSEDATGDVLAGSVHEPVFPFTIVSGGLRAAQADAELVLRLRSADEITPESIWSLVPDGYLDEQVTMEWKPVIQDDLTDIWVIFRITDFWILEDLISATVGAMTATGEALETGAQFQIESLEDYDARTIGADNRIWQPQPDVDFDTTNMDMTSESNDEIAISEGASPGTPTLSSATGTPFTVGPERVYTQPQRVWLPVPEGGDPNAIQIYYYHGTGTNPGWYPAENVEDWLVPDSQLTLEFNGTTYIGFLVRHAGIVQLGVPKEQP